jgi:hypothetical protein
MHLNDYFQCQLGMNGANGVTVLRVGLGLKPATEPATVLIQPSSTAQDPQMIRRPVAQLPRLHVKLQFNTKQSSPFYLGTTKFLTTLYVWPTKSKQYLINSV